MTQFYFSFNRYNFTKQCVRRIAEDQITTYMLSHKTITTQNSTIVLLYLKYPNDCLHFDINSKVFSSRRRIGEFPDLSLRTSQIYVFSAESSDPRPLTKPREKRSAGIPTLISPHIFSIANYRKSKVYRNREGEIGEHEGLIIASPAFSIPRAPSNQTIDFISVGQPEVTTDRGLVADDSDGNSDGDQDTDGASSSTTITTPTSSTTVGQQDTSFCGSGRIGSIPSASSLGRSTPPGVLQLLWVCSMILISLSGNGALHNNSLACWSPFALLRLISSSCLLLGTRLGLEDSLRFAFLGPRAAKIAVVRSLLFVLGMPRRAVMKCRRRGWWWWRSWRRSSSRHFRWKSRLKEEERRPRVLRRFGGRARGRVRLDYKQLARVPVAMPRGISGRITRRRRWERWRWWRTPDSVAFWRSVLRGASISILGLSPKLAACSRRFRDWWCWWLWRWWRECRDEDAFVFSWRKNRTAACGTRRRRGRRRRRRRRRRRGRSRRRGRRRRLSEVRGERGDVACSAKSTSRKDPP